MTIITWVMGAKMPPIHIHSMNIFSAQTVPICQSRCEKFMQDSALPLDYLQSHCGGGYVYLEVTEKDVSSRDIV